MIYVYVHLNLVFPSLHFFCLSCPKNNHVGLAALKAAHQAAPRPPPIMNPNTTPGKLSHIIVFRKYKCTIALMDNPIINNIPPIGTTVFVATERVM